MSGYTYWHPVTLVDASGVPITPSGGVAQGTASAGQPGTLVQGVSTTANPAYTTAQINPLSLTLAGGVRSALYPAAGTAFLADSNGAMVVRLATAAATGRTMARVMSAATTNATSVKTSVGNVAELCLSNSGAAEVFFKFYNKASAPTVGTDTPVWTVRLPALSTVSFSAPEGLAFATGIAYAITNLVADSDTTAVALNQVTGMFSYT